MNRKTELENEESVSESVPDVATEQVQENDVKETEWILDRTVGTKECKNCGAVMRGWAYRETFEYCPKCGHKAKKAI